MQWHLLHFASVCLEYYVAEASDKQKNHSVDAKEKENSIILGVWKAECSRIWTCHCHTFCALLFGQTQVLHCAVAKAIGAQPRHSRRLDASKTERCEHSSTFPIGIPVRRTSECRCTSSGPCTHTSTALAKSSTTLLQMLCG